MKLEVGMYVRTKVGIFKIRKITKDLAYWKHEKRVLELDRNIPEYNYRFSFYKDESIFKGAKFKDNIIDLIEVGDYVNGKLVSSLPLFKNEFIFDEPVNGVKYIKGIVGTPIEDNKDNFIKSIVTKEMFESMSYKVGD